MSLLYDYLICVQAQLLDKAAGAYVRFRLGGVRVANYTSMSESLFITDSVSS